MDKDILKSVFPDGEVIETHLSLVVLSGEFAFKWKKNVKYAFVDQSTLAFRHELCQREILLNTPYAPSIYLNVVCLRKDNNSFVLSDDLISKPETIVDYAVKMRRFSLEGEKALVF
jgi:aminoglycoside phosphotransferase family enzyme